MPFPQNGVPSANLPGGLNPSSFGSVGGAVANQHVLSSIFSYDPFAFYRGVAQRHSSMPSFRQMLRLQKATRGVKAPTTGHYEQDWKTNLVPFGTVATAAGAAGANLIINLAAGAMYNAGATVGGAARQASHVRVGDVMQAPNGVRARVMDKNTTVTPHRITLRPLKAADNLDTAFLANGTYAIFDNMHAEASNIPESLIPRLIKYENTFQIVKGGGATSGTELTNVLFAQFVPMQDNTIYVAIKADEMERYERAMCYALLFGTQADNIVVASTQLQHDVSMRGTEGLIPFLDAWGHLDTYIAGSYAIGDFDVLASIFEQERIGTRQITTYDGYSIFQETENALQNLLNANLTIELMKKWGADWGASSENMQPFDSDSFDFYIGFRALKKSGYAFYFRLLHEFNEYVGAGAPNYKQTTYRLALPLGYANDRNSGSPVPYISYEYKSDGRGYDRHDRIDEYGGIGSKLKASNGDDMQAFGIVSEIALHAACPNKTVKQYVA